KNGKKNEKENRKGNEVSNFESIEDTSFIDHAPMQKTKSKENLYNTYIKDLSTAKNIALSLFKELKIKKDIIKNSVLKRVSEVYKTINEKGAEKYINTIILNTVAFFEVLSKKYNMQVVINKKSFKKKRVSNFEGRKFSKADFEDMYDDPSIAFQ
ncbi:MAG: hypothetical protein ACRC6T_13490, partial [Sarcina sp.]